MENLHLNNESPQEILEYWTEERIQKANSNPFEHENDWMEEEATNKETFTNNENNKLSLGYTKVDNPTEEPWKYVGRLYFTWSGNDVYATAFIISDDAVLTCAHLIYSAKSGYSKKLMFIPAASSSEEAPYGKFPSKHSVIMPGYNNSTQNDIALVYLSTNSSGDHVGKNGYLELAEASLDIETKSVGYSNGKSSEDIYYQSGKPKIGVFYNSTHMEGLRFSGASGGPWIYDKGDKKSYGVGGIQSHSSDSYLISPLFNKSVLEFAKYFKDGGLPMSPPWIMFFEDSSGSEDISLRGFHKIVFLYDDEEREKINNIADFSKLNPDSGDASQNFKDKTSGAIYYLPAGLDVHLYSKTNYGQGLSYVIKGTGGLNTINFASEGFNDKAMSMKWIGYEKIPYTNTTVPLFSMLFDHVSNGDDNRYELRGRHRVFFQYINDYFNFEEFKADNHESSINDEFSGGMYWKWTSSDGKLTIGVSIFEARDFKKNLKIASDKSINRKIKEFKNINGYGKLELLMFSLAGKSSNDKASSLEIDEL
ncbi:MAG: trypsin-like serine protease [Bacteroidota bacterium]